MGESLGLGLGNEALGTVSQKAATQGQQEITDSQLGLSFPSFHQCCSFYPEVQELN